MPLELCASISSCLQLATYGISVQLLVHAYSSPKDIAFSMKNVLRHPNDAQSEVAAPKAHSFVPFFISYTVESLLASTSPTS